MCKHYERTYVWLEKRLEPIDRCLAIFILQLNLAGIKTLDSCCAHGNDISSVICEKGSEEKLKEFGCKIIKTREGDGKVFAFFPFVGNEGKSYVEREYTYNFFDKKPDGSWELAEEFI